MPKLLQKIEGNTIDLTQDSVNFITLVSGELQSEDYINLNGFIAYLQNFSETKEINEITKPINFGLKNSFNIQTVTLEINY